MTATQVFLRFVKSQYTSKDGTINPMMLAAWRKELRSNSISSKRNPSKVRERVRTSKNFVDDYLYNHRYTLSGFINHFLQRRASYRFDYAYGFIVSDMERRIKENWKSFLLNHIKGEKKQYWIKGREFNFEWVE